MMLKGSKNIMSKIRICILGANSHIAKGLINNFLQVDYCSLILFTRSSDKTNLFISSLENIELKNITIKEGYEEFYDDYYDVIINCVGVGTSNKLDGKYWKWLTVTEEFDNKVIKYLQTKSSEALYISLSSGVVYGNGSSVPAQKDTCNQINVNHISPESYYSIARLNSETKHRAFSNLNIVDLRLFSYFSRYIDLSDNYLLTEIINNINTNNKFITNNQNIIRDYIHPKDLFTLILKCIEIKNINDVFDVYSAGTVEKFEILEFFKTYYKLDYKIIDKQMLSGTGLKNNYYSIFHKAEKIGYKPKFISLNVIEDESRYLINNID